MTLKDYARQHGLSIPAARAQLAELALTQLEARSRGGARTQSTRTPAERQAHARKAIAARWAAPRTGESEGQGRTNPPEARTDDSEAP